MPWVSLYGVTDWVELHLYRDHRDPDYYVYVEVVDLNHAAGADGLLLVAGRWVHLGNYDDPEYVMDLTLSIVGESYPPRDWTVLVRGFSTEGRGNLLERHGVPAKAVVLRDDLRTPGRTRLLRDWEEHGDAEALGGLRRDLEANGVYTGRWWRWQDLLRASSCRELVEEFKSWV